MLNQFFKIIILFFCLINLSKISSAQVGYFGSTLGLDLQINTAPSYRRIVSFDSTNNYVIKKPRVANIGFQLGLFSITNYRSEWGVGIEYSKVDLYTQGVSILSKYHYGSGYYAEDYFDLLENPEIKYIGLTAYYKFYFNRRKLPIGYFIKFDFKVGRSIYKADEAPIFGHVLGVVDSTRFSETRKVALIDDYDNIENVKTDINTIFCKLAVGRTFPITDYFSASVAFSAPVLAYNSSFYHPGDFYNDNNLKDVKITWFTGSSWKKIIFHTATKYNGPSLDFNFKFYF